jgi:protein SCO1/2
LALIIAVVLVLGIVVVVAGTGGSSSSGASSSSGSPSGEISPSSFDGAALPASTPVRPFTLTDQSGRAVALGSLRGKVTILAFVDSTCGATCFLIAQQIRGALNELPHPVPVLFVSTEPRGDTPASVARFLAQSSLSGRVLYLSGSLAALRPIWRAYHIVPATQGRAAFEKFASILILDGSGRARVLFQLEQLTPEGLAHDVRKLS